MEAQRHGKNLLCEKCVAGLSIDRFALFALTHGPSLS